MSEESELEKKRKLFEILDSLDESTEDEADPGLLASVVVLTLRSFRHLTAAPEGDRVASSPATWEAVA